MVGGARIEVVARGTAFAGALLAYYLIPTSGKRIGIHAQIKHGRDTFGDHLQRLVTTGGVPVVEEDQQWANGAYPGSG